MKKFIFLGLFALICLIASCSNSNAQSLHRDGYPQYCTSGQFVKIGHTYVNTLNDTVSSATVYLTLCDNAKGGFTPYALNDWGMMDISVIGTKASSIGSSGGISIESSGTGLDGSWASCLYDASHYFKDTLKVDSALTSFSKTWHFQKISPYYRIKIIQSNTAGKISYNAYYFFQKSQDITLPQSVR